MKRYIPTYESFIGLSHDLKTNITKISKRINYKVDFDKISSTNLDTDIFFISIDDDTKYLNVFFNKTIKAAIDKYLVGHEFYLRQKFIVVNILDENNKESNLLYGKIIACDIIDKCITLTVTDKEEKVYKCYIKGFDINDIDEITTKIKPTKVKFGKVIREILMKSNHNITDKTLTHLAEFMDFENVDVDNVTVKVLENEDIFKAYDTSYVLPTSALGESCMMDKINDETVPFTSVIALYDTKTNLIIARAYLWTIADVSPLKSKYKYLVDRIYASSDHARRLLENYIIEKEYLYRTNELDFGIWKIVDLKNHNEINLSDIIVHVDLSFGFDNWNMLFVDTFRYMNALKGYFSITEKDYCSIRIPKYDSGEDFDSNQFLGLDVFNTNDVIDYDSYYGGENMFTRYDLRNDNPIIVATKNDIFEYIGEHLLNKEEDFMPEIINYGDAYFSDFYEFEIYGELISRSILSEIEELYDTIIPKIDSDLSTFIEFLENKIEDERVINFFTNYKKIYDYLIEHGYDTIDKDSFNVELIYKNSKGQITYYPLC
jgi:hypothetical protein